jgi:hypothetical protein
MGKHKRTKAQIEADAQRTGRPPKKPEDLMAAGIMVRLTADELKALDAEAGRLNMKRAQYLVDCWKRRQAMNGN